MGIYRSAALLLVAVVAALRVAYLIWDCPYDLAPDEAHYWDWSRHLDWSYYSKGPGVAWLIRASTAVLGDTMWAMRLPAVICGSLTLLGLFELTWRCYRQPRLALGVLLLALTIPALAVGSLLMTIDAPYVCCWTWALMVAHAVCLPNDPHTKGRRLMLWSLLGLLIGIGILCKYTMVIFVPSLALYLILARGYRRLALWREALCLCLPIALCLLPILIWNAQHDWVTLFHVGRQAGVQNGPAIRWLGPLEYLSGQFAALLGFWFIWWVSAVVRCTLSVARRGPGLTDNEIFLSCFSVPMFLLFLAFSFKTRVELNWPVTAYLSGAVLIAGWVMRQCSSPVGWWRCMSQSSLAVAAALGLALVLLLHHTEWLYPAVSSQRAASNPSPPTTRLSPIRRWDPSCRLRGWQTLGAEVQRTREHLRMEGTEPLLAASGWALPGELGFYLPDHPEVYSFALANGGRRSQYDFWRPNPIWDPEQFQGRTFVYVGDLSPSVRRAFDRVESSVEVTHEVQGQTVASWPITVCRGFRGFPHISLRGY